jgi:hypothetical protein
MVDDAQQSDTGLSRPALHDDSLVVDQLASRSSGRADAALIIIIIVIVIAAPHRRGLNVCEAHPPCFPPRNR